MINIHIVTQESDAIAMKQLHQILHLILKTLLTCAFNATQLHLFTIAYVYRV